MYNAAGDSLGTAKLTEQSDGVQIKLKLEGLTPGFHAIHVHEFPKCEGPDFKSAGNHFNPDSKKHGLMHPEGSHLGDLPNIEVGGDGTVDAEMMINKATLKDGKNSLLSGEGTSLIIHAGQDDGVSQPAGNAGERIACGKIQLEEADKDDEPQNPAETGEEKKEAGT
ncbi:MAG: superoxide dismutase family protein [Bacillaceae bacterium]|nr:superoxide dismutase family protein [Bacillaceae bacterium]